MFVSLVVGPNCEMESYAIRSVLEYFGIRVNIHWIGRPNDFLKILSGEELDNKLDYLILNFHGDEGKFCMPELSVETYTDTEPKGKFFGPNEIEKYTNLKGVKIISSGCTLGTEKLANAFLTSGCHSYLAPDDYIDGNANSMFIITFMYEMINNHRNEKEAFEIARLIDSDTSMYKWYQS